MINRLVKIKPAGTVIMAVIMLTFGFSNLARADFFDFLTSSSNLSALLLFVYVCLTKKLPFFTVPEVTTIVATAPLPTSILDSKTIPVALDSKSVFKSKISACNTIDSTNLSKFFFVLAEI